MFSSPTGVGVVAEARETTALRATTVISEVLAIRRLADGIVRVVNC